LVATCLNVHQKVNGFSLLLLLLLLLLFLPKSLLLASFYLLFTSSLLLLHRTLKVSLTHSKDHP